MASTMISIENEDFVFVLVYLTDVSSVVVLHKHHSHTGNVSRESLFATRHSLPCGGDKPGRQLWSVIAEFSSSYYSWQSCQPGACFYPSGVVLAISSRGLFAAVKEEPESRESGADHGNLR